jgi:reductive dehalogenase
MVLEANLRIAVLRPISKRNTMMNNTERYQELLVGPIERFDQRRDMFRRSRYDPEWVERSNAFYGRDKARDKPGYSQAYYALVDAAWYVEDFFAMGTAGSNHRGLYAWDTLDPELHPAGRVDVSDPVEASRKIKTAARFFGAALVGICRLDQRWLYSHVSDDIAREQMPLEITEDYRYAVAMAIEMDYDFIQTAPTGGSAAATGLGYSKMAFVAGLLAQFIRGLGYQAIPCGNDTALSIPIAVEAGLGELGRNGLLITEKFGPRVRICKVFTDLPLVPDEVQFLGVEAFCRTCLKCAALCPSRAISFGERTTAAPTMSNNPGVLKWPINPEQCFKYWLANGVDCATCIRVCPFNQKAGRHHDLARATIKRTSHLNPLLLWFDKVLGYGKRLPPESIWEH